MAELQPSLLSLGLFVRLEAKTGREEDVENFLRKGLDLVDEEPATVVWFALRLGPSTFGIFDGFPDEPARQAHLQGKVAQALEQQGPDLLASPPVIERCDILAARLPALAASGTD
jgi:quinol monooxygenase YgiN